MPVPGSDILSKILHLVSQSLLLPVIAGLLLFIAFALVELGGLFAEFAQRTKVTAGQVEMILQKLHKSFDPAEVIAESALSARQKAVLQKLLANSFLPEVSLRALARKLLEEEELKSVRAVEKTDLVARLGPSLGLMGTLIPLGPGLAAFGTGNVEGLAEALIIAFDTTVAGLAAGGLAWLVLKVRKRWYEEHISTLDAVMEPLMEVLENAKKKANIVEIKGRC